ncbi:MAG: biosynthetic-type acetolactate synthase large subunit [Anaerolineales bacterium]|nr:biosynthetic-type acetolactate synthase large subunit [Anaerolineales bacterium]
MKMRGAEIVWECLTREGVDVVFGYPGGANMPIYDAMLNYPVHHVLARHEQGAAHMADGYARASGKVGVAMTTSGPGATNLVTGIATAMMDSIPTVFITGQVPSHLIGGDAFQEVDVTGITLPITKHNYLVMHAEELAETIREAFHVARSGRPGPVLIDICKNAQVEMCDFVYPELKLRERQSAPSPRVLLDEAAHLIEKAKRPVILCGHGAIISGAEEELMKFAVQTQTPVTSTLLGLGAFPASHELSLGMMGMHGESHANMAIQNADLLLAFGMRFDDRVTGVPKTYAPGAKKIHIEIDPAEVNKNVRVDVPLVGDLKSVLRDLLPLLGEYDHEEWKQEIAAWKAESDSRNIINWEDDGKLYAAHVVNDIWEATGGAALVTTDVGQHQMWSAQYYLLDKPNRWITSGGAGTMGFGLPSAIGAWFAAKNEEVWAIVGDGGFQMTSPELTTAVQEGANVKVAVLNNRFLGMVRQWQEFFFEKRYSAVNMLTPDFVKLAEAHGIPARRVTKREDAAEAIEWARKTEGPVVLEFSIEMEDAVYPMVPAGAALHEMLQRPMKA